MTMLTSTQATSTTCIQNHSGGIGQGYGVRARMARTHASTVPRARRPAPPARRCAAMIIGPGQPGKDGGGKLGAPKGKKARKRKARREPGAQDAVASDTDLDAVGPDAPRGLEVVDAVGPDAPDADVPDARDARVPDPERPDAPDTGAKGADAVGDATPPPGTEVVARIDALRERVASLMVIADGRGPSGPDPAAGLGAPSAPGPARPLRASASAVLVARELLAGGMTPEGVRTRLGEAYGVADPDAVLASAR